MQQVLTASRRNSQHSVAPTARPVHRDPAGQHRRPGAVGMGTATQGDAGWRRLCQLHSAPLLTFTLRLTGGDRRRAEAIVEHTLQLAWRHADRLAAGAALRPWLISTARRVAAGQETTVQAVLTAMDDAGRPANRVRVEAALDASPPNSGRRSPRSADTTRRSVPPPARPACRAA